MYRKHFLLFLSIFLTLLIFSCQHIRTKEEVDLAEGLKNGTITADLIIDGFEEDLAWWPYLDEEGSKVDIQISEPIIESESRYLKIDADIKSGGYGGVEMEFPEIQRLAGSKGIVINLKSDRADIPVVLVIWVQDPTQTSPFVNYKTPFNYLFHTRSSSVDNWEQYVFPWNGFERSTWLGEKGVWTLDPNLIVGMEFAFENKDSNEKIEGTILVDDIRVIIDSDTLLANEVKKTDQKYNPIKVNQIGYKPDGEKLFFSSSAAWKFNLFDETTEKIVYSGSMQFMDSDADTGMEIYGGVFTEFTISGRYFIEVVGVGESYHFEIRDNIYDNALYITSRFFYNQRSGMDIQLEGFKDAVIKKGHSGKAVLWDDNLVKKELSGGWYDAGDYGRYMPTAAFSVNQLFYAFEFNPGFFKDGSLNIPESGNGIPDLLDEIGWELSWMLKMQADNGMVYHKVTTKDYPEMGSLPSEDKQQLYLFGPTSSDTAYFTAVMAKAATVFEPYDQMFSEVCREAALKSYTWLLEHPDQFPSGGFQNPPPSKFPMQGGYDFIGSEDHSRMWASAEVYRMIHDKKAYDSFTSLFNRSGNTSGFLKMDWAEPYGLALYAFLESLDHHDSFYNEVLSEFKGQVDRIIAVSERSFFNTVLSGRNGGFAYVWGSNQVVSANGVELIMAYNLFGDKIYLEAAEHQIQYLMGRNGLSKCFISGTGSDSVLYPHHNLSIYLGSAVPGIVGEGPNGAVGEGSGGDMVLENLWKDKTPPALCYKDSFDSWATNEPTIDANASFVALLSYFCR